MKWTKIYANVLGVLFFGGCIAMIVFAILDKEKNTSLLDDVYIYQDITMGGM